ncbi:OmpA family protein [Brumicola pallidula]|uniref:Inner membrane lipoprotein yiaD n=1 Tax=Brumicola pallidula DSM 14239 = ACAM 615 TaxID=1121922 RepID=K7A234_9ALTE|nr:OmpA family protein [Glaciecola pallidula]GAC29585.1 inner membrane lipoprotein yiaD [Glaciecola pallidula DSM 14239 = ACAM 615]
MKILSVAISLSCLLLVTSCATYDPYTGEQEVSKAGKGAGIGAGVAAVVAYLANKDKDAGKRNERILKAAAGGAAIGGSIGYYMDVQEAKLREQLRGSGVSVERDGDNINLVMPGNITFASGNADIAQGFLPVLDSVILVLTEFNKTLVVVSGHTDSTGSGSLNQNLSEKRAQSVSDYFFKNGIIRDRLDVIGFGETQAIASNATEQGKQKNRRVEISLLPITQP